VWSEITSNPVAVKLAWADNPIRVDLFKIEGLSASPF
jgi:hypothetical protein